MRRRVCSPEHCWSSCFFSCYMIQGPNLSPVEWLYLKIEITPRGVHPSHPCPMALGETIFCLWIMVFPCGTLHVDSLNCPSWPKHTPLKKNQYVPLLFFLSVPEHVLWWSASLHYEGKWWGVSYYTPLAGIGFYFPEEYLCSVKQLIKKFPMSCKRACMCGSCCHYCCCCCCRSALEQEHQ